jgi:hypothetical protein
VSLGLGVRRFISGGLGVILGIGSEKAPRSVLGLRIREEGRMFRIHRIGSENKLKGADALLSAIIESTSVPELILGRLFRLVSIESALAKSARVLGTIPSRVVDFFKVYSVNR